MRIRYLVAIVSLGALAGCVKSDFEKICRAEELSGVSGKDEPSQKATKIAHWLQSNIHSSDAKQFLAAITGVESARDKAKLLRQAALEAGYTGPCPMADDGEKAR